MSSGSKDDDLGLLPVGIVGPSQGGHQWPRLGKLESSAEICAALEGIGDVKVAIAEGESSATETSVPIDAAAMIDDVAKCDATSLAAIVGDVEAFVTSAPADPGSTGVDADLSAYGNPPFAISEVAREEIIKRFNRGDSDE